MGYRNTDCCNFAVAGVMTRCPAPKCWMMVCTLKIADTQRSGGRLSWVCESFRCLYHAARCAHGSPPWRIRCGPHEHWKPNLVRRTMNFSAPVVSALARATTCRKTNFKDDTADAWYEVHSTFTLLSLYFLSTGQVMNGRSMQLHVDVGAEREEAEAEEEEEEAMMQQHTETGPFSPASP